MGFFVSLLIGAGLGWLAVKLYNLWFTPEERAIIENEIKTHHLEYGIGATAIGALTNSPKITGTGLYWILDDLDDADEAIQNLKRKWKRFCDKIDQFSQVNSRTTVNLEPSYNPFYNTGWPYAYQNTNPNLTVTVEKVKNWLSNKKREILQNIQNNTGLNYQPNYHW